MRAHRFHSTCRAAPQNAFRATILLALLALGTTPRPAHASADIDCDADVRVRHAAFSRCNNMMALGPGNDTRTNLLLLLFDRDMPAPDFVPPYTTAKRSPSDAIAHFFWQEVRDRFFEPKPRRATGFADGEGSRCLSDGDGAAAFTTGLDVAPGLPAEERDALVGARKSLAPNCKTSGKAAEAEPAAVPGVHTPTGQAFATYLQGTQGFYEGRFDTALAAFAKLHGNTNSWLANAGDYMVARTDLNRLQIAAFDEYGEFVGSNKIDQKAAAQVAANFEAYLRDHPTGIYAGSARGLLRRVHWLAGHTEALAASYAALIAMSPAERGIDDATLAEEIGSKLLPALKPEMTRDPILLAAFDLMAMREPADKQPDLRHIDLEAQRTAFAAAPLLFDYLAATQALYVDNDAAKALKLVPDDTRRRGGDHLWFSRQVLRGLALEAKGDRNTRGFWKELAPGANRPIDRLTVELALAMHDERAGTLDDVFAKGSIVTSPEIRKVLLEHAADVTLLRRDARDADVPEAERQIALSTLLLKEIARGRFSDFVADVALVPPGAPTEKTYGAAPRAGAFIQAPGEIACPALPTTAARLADDPQAVRSRLCLAEFVRVNGLDQTSPDSKTPNENLGGAPSKFPAKAFARGEVYKAIIADTAAAPDDRAFALYRAVKCYEPANSNGCGGEDVPKARRKAWYFALKRDYPASRWAKTLTYWW